MTALLPIFLEASGWPMSETERHFQTDEAGCLVMNLFSSQSRTSFSLYFLLPQVGRSRTAFKAAPGRQKPESLDLFAKCFGSHLGLWVQQLHGT